MAEQPASREPMLNVPTVVVLLLVLLVLVYVMLAFVLNDEQTNDFLLLFAFLPARYSAAALAGAVAPGGLAADIWTFVTYALIHADFTHLLFNAIWLLPFGAPVARRFGTVRFLVFMAAAAAGGAAVQLATHFGERQIMIGASAAVSGAMAAAIRFAFARGAPLGLFSTHQEAYRVPVVPLSVPMRDPRVLGFVLAWFGINLIFGIGAFAMPGVSGAIAWEAHIGGFLVGLLGFSLFDPVPMAKARSDTPNDPGVNDQADSPPTQP